MAISDRPSGAEQCPECGGRVETTDTEAVCASCGLVVEDAPIDHGPEWRNVDLRNPKGGDPRRAKPGDRDFGDRGLGSEVGVLPDEGTLPKRLRKTHKHTRLDRQARTRAYGTTEIQRIAGQLDLPDTLTTQAKSLYRQAHEAGELAGRDLDTVAATCLYTVCRVNQRGVTASEVAEFARTDARPIERRHTWLSRTLGVPVPPPDPAQRVRVVAREAGINSKGRERAIQRLESLPDETVHRGSPSTLAAALLYEATDETQAALAEAAGCCEVGLRNRRDAIRAAEPKGQTEMGEWGNV